MKEQAIDLLKKFWFVILVGAIFISFAIFFAWDTNKDKIPGKSVNGKDVIFSTDKTNYTADQYYNSLYNVETDGTKAGTVLLYTLLEKEVAEKSIDADDDMKEKAKTVFENSSAYYQQQYGDQYEVYITKQLQQLGYDGIDDFENFYLNQLKVSKLMSNYIKKHTELFDEVYEKDAPRELSHILVSCADPANPTAEETKKMEDVKKALADGQKFTKVAKKYSDDTGTKDLGGKLGVQLKSGSLVEEFKNAAWNIEEGQMSDWVKTEYGYHLILVDSTDKKEMLNNKDNEDSIQNAVLTYYPKLQKETVWKTAKKLNVKITDKTLKKELLAYIGVEK